MAIHILKSTDPVEITTTIVLIYGDPGAGKTSLGFSAIDPLLLDFDRGAHRSAYRRDSVPIDAWAQISGLDESDLASYQTIVVDTVGRCLDALAVEIQRRNPKTRTAAGGLTLQGYGELKASFAAWMRQLRAFGKDVVLLAHGTESRQGDDLILRPDITGGSYGELFKIADSVGVLRMVGGQRTLEFDPRERFVGKNPASIAPVAIPNLTTSPHVLADLLVEIKGAIGRLSEEASAVVAIVADHRVAVDAASSAEDLGGLLSTVGEIANEAAAKLVKTLIWRRAKDLGIEWDKTAERFVSPAPPEKPARGAKAKADANLFDDEASA